jgi:hypothetical protein
MIIDERFLKRIYKGMYITAMLPYTCAGMQRNVAKKQKKQKQQTQTNKYKNEPRIGLC